MANIEVEIPPIKLVPVGSETRASSSNDSSSSDWAKSAKTVLIVAVLIIAGLFVGKTLLPYAAAYVGINPQQKENTQDKDCNKKTYKGGRSYNPVIYNIEPVTPTVPQDNSLEKATEYTDKEVGKLRGEMKEGFDGVNKRMDGIETNMNNGFNDIKGMLKEKNKPPKTDCPPETDDSDPTN